MIKFFGEPWDGLLNALLILVGFYGGILCIGFLMNKIEMLFVKSLTRIFGTKVSLFICNRLTWPGVVLHEYSHAFFGFLFGAKITKIRTLEVFKGDQLGHVEFYTAGNSMHQCFQYTFIACAPTIMGSLFLLLLILVFWMKVNFWLQYVLIVYFSFAILCHMSMSPSDVKNYIRGFKWVLPLSYVIIYLARIFFIKFMA